MPKKKKPGNQKEQKPEKQKKIKPPKRRTFKCQVQVIEIKIYNSLSQLHELTILLPEHAHHGADAKWEAANSLRLKLGPVTLTSPPPTTDNASVTEAVVLDEDSEDNSKLPLLTGQVGLLVLAL